MTLVDGVSLEIERGEFIAIMGPSGSGKSSLLYLLGLLDVPTEGRVWLDGEDTSGYGEDELANRRLREARLRVPVPLPARRVLRARQRHAADAPARRARRRGGATRAGWSCSDGLGVADQSAQAAAPALRRPAPARRDRARARQRPARHPRRRADRKSRLGVERQRAADPARSRPRDGKTVVAVTHDGNFASAADQRIGLVDGKINTEWRPA